MQTATLGRAHVGHPRPAALGKRLSQAEMLLFRCALIALEAGCVFAGGHFVRGWRAIVGGLPFPAGLTAAYVALTLVSGTWIELPDKRRLWGAAQTLAAVFVVALLLQQAPATAITGAVAWFALAMAGIASTRGVAAHLADRMPSLAVRPRPVAFIGNSEAAARMLRQIEADPHRRAVAIGYFDDRITRAGPLTNLLPCLGNVDELVSYLTEHELHDVYMAMPWSAGERISVLLDRMRFLPLIVRLLPDRTVPALGSSDAERLEGVVMPTLMLPPFSVLGAIAKRSCDLVFSGLLLVPLAILFIVVAALIKLDSKGPVFFRQARSGQYGRSFHIYKFRSLHVALADSGAETLVSRGDRRVTRVGRYLRKYSIDELPQIINVILGDMSLVGPRPHAPRAKADGRIYAEVMPDYMLRYRVKPGMTGWAQVNGWRGNTDTEEKLRKRVEFDFDYISAWSLWRDIKILFRTIPSTLAPPPGNA